MNADIMEGKWKQMRGQMKEWWGQLTDDDFDVIAGKKDKLIGKLQERYGWAKRDAEDEVARRFRDVDAATRNLPARRHHPSVASPPRVTHRLGHDKAPRKGEHYMRHLFRSMLVLVMLMAVTAGCTSMTGKSAGENVDDASITASVKTKLAAEKPATLTKVDVDTNKGTVYLTGNVGNATIKERATEIARQVAGVREVVNNLKVQ